MQCGVKIDTLEWGKNDEAKILCRFITYGEVIFTPTFQFWCSRLLYHTNTQIWRYNFLKTVNKFLNNGS